ncbi:hypothetical protein B0T26DRAFT_749219 [Lasiosphaeria miniovina]|uniref:DNA-directed RNA polymerase III subunit rpc5 n=1 Tax=Lasiosphaeria miniovina TaxID=1954250 RepID=A0AA40E1Q9_9PEZI|nr:uncharacterized protein B0T26DRAFT_749219 [Lasiosphaeria miniovina]KAK0721732.1 hypothetical protein B0T26DRAFT_749219 [Lasiosphaeria miniovina]
MSITSATPPLILGGTSAVGNNDDDDDPVVATPPLILGGTSAVVNNDDDDDDPVVATYSVFVKPPLPTHRRLVVMQFVNKTSSDPAQIRPPRIGEIRVKPETGMFEVDVPVETGQAYDRGKGVAWGSALHKSMEAKKGGSLGLAGGFGIGGPSSRGGGAGGRGGRRGGGGVGNGLGGNDDGEGGGGGQLTWAEAMRQDKVLRTQTLIGNDSKEEVNTTYMVGVFQGKNIHLTPVSSLVHLRPAAHHLDAITEQERLARPSAGGPAAGAADKANAVRAIHMTVKAAMDEDGASTETIADRLWAVQTEPWRRMEWVHDEDESAWQAYNECLLLRTSGAPGPAPEAPETDNELDDEKSTGAKDKGKGKGKEVATGPSSGNADDSGAPNLASRVAHLETDWGEEELLRAVSGITATDKKPGEEALPQPGPARPTVPKPKGKAKETMVKAEEKTEEPRRRPGRPAAAAGASRGGRTRAAPRGRAAGPSSAVEL